tara:strand:- start:382 stop:600 length:219 start_codon:yes stop_codon:yes gene_type:complete
MKNLRTKLSYAFYTLLVAFLMVGCNEPTKYESKKENGMTYKIIVIDSCEYIWYKDNNHYGQTMAHKGNCKNH